MNTSTGNKKTTYTITDAMFENGKFEVVIRKFENGECISVRYMSRLDGIIRLFSSRNGARKAIVRAIRSARGERGALHR